MATARLYLDTARLGQMCSSSQLAIQDFAKLSGEVALTLYGKNFLMDGFSAVPQTIAPRYRGLLPWRGMEGLKRSLLQLVNAPNVHRCLFASRSLTLLRAAARVAATHCRCLMVPDLNWPPYASELKAVLKETKRHVVEPSLRQIILQESWNESDLSSVLCNQFVASGCDAVLLPAVTHDGIRLPLTGLLKELRRSGCRFVLIDACQQLTHTPETDWMSQADLVVTGVHKWLRAGLPFGVAFAKASIAEEIARQCCDDPLAAFTTSEHEPARVMETVNVWPLISCAAAVGEKLREPRSATEVFQTRLANADRLIAAISPSQWRPVRSAASMQSGILVLRAKAADSRAPEWRNYLEQQAIDVSSLDGTHLRFSLPGRPFLSSELRRLAEALTIPVPH